MSWLTGWTYRKSHVINSAVGAETNYQVRIKVHYGSGTDYNDNTVTPPLGHVYLNSHCKVDFGDIRFTDDDGVTLLDYWMEEKSDGDYAIFWVEIADDLSASDVTIYIYYGKTDAIYDGDPDDTFILALDDEGTPIGSLPSGWSDNSTGTCSVSVQDDQVKLGSKVCKLVDDDGGANAICNSSPINWTGKYVIRFYYRYNYSSSLAIYHNLVVRDSSGTACWIVRFYQDDTRRFCVYTDKYYDRVSSKVLQEDTWYLIQIFIDNDSGKILNIKIDEEDVDDPNNHLPISWVNTPHYFQIGCMGTSDLGNSWYDGFIVRKYVDPEPTHGSWGLEETSGGTANVTTKDASNVTPSSATLNAYLSKGSNQISKRGFDWGTESGNYDNEWIEEGDFESGDYSHNIDGLTHNTTYYFRAKIYDVVEGWIYGGELTFTTEKVDLSAPSLVGACVECGD